MPPRKKRPQLVVRMYVLDDTPCDCDVKTAIHVADLDDFVYDIYECTKCKITVTVNDLYDDFRHSSVELIW